MSGEPTREQFFARIPSKYSGYVHWISINIFGVGVIGGCMTILEAPQWWEWLFIPGFFVFSNGFEWWIHRGPMHHPTRGLRILYRRHTLEHHVIFTDETMGLRNARELFFVLFPPGFLPAILVVNLPVPLLLGLFVSRNLAALFYLSVLAYYLVYEWFHFLHHVPADTWIGRRTVVAWCRQHHTRHHELARMSHGNFNVSFPLWDWLLGTMLPAGASESG